jgi:excinuclease UvrABC helicase subunit UvrB
MYSEQLKKTDLTKLKREVDGLLRLDNGKLCNDEGLIVSEAMRKAINLTYYRRNLQDKYNKEN